MTDGETASLHVRISFGERVVDFFHVGAASNYTVARRLVTLQRPGSLPGNIRPPAMGPSDSRSDQRRGFAHAWYEIMVIFDPDTEEHTVQPTLEKHLK